jgi:phosphocarrier protein
MQTMIEKNITIINKLGLHARAAAKFVTTSSQFQSEIHVTRNGRTVNGKSIMGLMMLAAAKDTEIMLTIEGDDEQQALNEIEALINDFFGEGE